MITLAQLKKAVLFNPDCTCIEGFEHTCVTGIEKQLIMSLDVYYRREEFDGTLESARECLTLAGYEFENVDN